MMSLFVAYDFTCDITVWKHARPLHCTLPPRFPSIQRILRVVQLNLRLSQLQSGVGAFTLSLFLLAECFICLGAQDPITPIYCS